MAAMGLTTTNATFRQLLGNGVLYRVPPFQRDYAWSETEWDDLWQDLLALFGDDADPWHYMGYLVLQSPDNKQFDIIDGQQRITTITLVILAALGHLRDLAAQGLDAANNALRLEQLRSSYIGYLDPVSLVSRSKIELNRHGNRFYQTWLVPLANPPLRGLNASEHQLRKASLWFSERIRAHVGSNEGSGRDLAAFIDALVDRLLFTVITVTDELNAFTVFETLNARGVRLSATDLLKNHLFSLVSSSDTHEAELRALEDRWERIVGLLGGESFPEFLRVHWNSGHKLVRKTDLFKTMRRHVTNREQAFALLRDLDVSATRYAALRDPHDPLWNDAEKRAIEQLLLCEVREPLALLMACHARFHGTERAGFTRLVRAVAIIAFRHRIICELPAHDLERICNNAAHQLALGAFSQPSEVLRALASAYPDDKRFKAAFANRAFRTTQTREKRIARHILFELERQRSSKDLDVESATYNLEHILPENPGEAWAHIPEAKQNLLTYRLGNLTPLESPQARRNRDVGNADYAHKRAAYATSVFQLTRAVAEHYEDWDESKVVARQKQMAAVAAGIWRVEFGG